MALLVAGSIIAAAIGQGIVALLLGLLYGALIVWYLAVCDACSLARCTLLGLFLALVVLIILLVLVPAAIVGAAGALAAWAVVFIPTISYWATNCIGRG